MTLAGSATSRSGWSKAIRIAVRVIFVCVPIVSFGYLTGPAFLLAAVWLRSWLLGLSAAFYLAVSVATCALSQGPMGSTLETVLSVHVGTNMVLGTVQAAFVQRRLFRRARSARADPAVAAAIARRERRREARQLLAQDPALAAELRIGRPDLPRQFDDGGLIDVNAVPPPVLAQLPGLRPQDVERILVARQGPFGLTSVEDLVVSAHVPAEVAESLREVLVFNRGQAPH